MPRLHGIIPAMVTPFREDERIDYNAWQVMIDTLIEAGVDGLLACGSSGEFYSLEAEERIVALRFCKQAIAGRVPFYVNVGCVTTRETVQVARQAEEIGADVLVVVTPFYVQPTQEELATHYIEVCGAVRAPVMAYNFPQHGGVELAAETVALVASQCRNLAGLKDSSGSLEMALAYRKAVTGRDFAVFVRSENLLLRALDGGCAGSMTACANVAPRLFVDLYRAFREGRRADAERLQALAAALGEANALHTYPSVLKEAMAMAGLPVGRCRRPILRMPPAARETLAGILDRLRTAGCLTAVNAR